MDIMSQLIDLTNAAFGRLVVISRMCNDRFGRAQWLCSCECGLTVVVQSNNLKSGNTRSCGCLNIRHGYCKTLKPPRVYNIWQCMVQRCINPNNPRYKDYGGRGIQVCEKWRKFQNFLDDVGDPPTKTHSIDRINNNKGYCKSNCQWATSKQQSRNTSRNLSIFFDNRRQCLHDWAKELNIHPSTLRNRIYKLGWSIKKALTTPVKQRRKTK